MRGLGHHFLTYSEWKQFHYLFDNTEFVQLNPDEPLTDSSKLLVRAWGPESSHAGLMQRPLSIPHTEIHNWTDHLCTDCIDLLARWKVLKSDTWQSAMEKIASTNPAFRRKMQ